MPPKTLSLATILPSPSDPIPHDPCVFTFSARDSHAALQTFNITSAAPGHFIYPSLDTNAESYRAGDVVTIRWLADTDETMFSKEAYRGSEGLIQAAQRDTLYTLSVQRPGPAEHVAYGTTRVIMEPTSGIYFFTETAGHEDQGSSEHTLEACPTGAFKSLEYRWRIPEGWKSGEAYRFKLAVKSLPGAVESRAFYSGRFEIVGHGGPVGAAGAQAPCRNRWGEVLGAPGFGLGVGLLLVGMYFLGRMFFGRKKRVLEGALKI